MQVSNQIGIKTIQTLEDSESSKILLTVQNILEKMMGEFAATR